VDNAKPGWQQTIKTFWSGLKPAQRIAIIAGGVLILALAAYAATWTQQPDYAALFSDLSEQDAAAVVEQLKALKEPYRLAQAGAVIQVPQRDVYDVRLQMAKQGLPKGGTVGFELFDNSQLGTLGMTDFMQRVDYQRALEGELARTIGSLDPVASARVHIVIPEQNLFISEQRDPTASIVLQLKPNADLSRVQVQAITHLVASSVEGLKAGNITLVDMQGNVLSLAGDGTDQAPADLQADSNQTEVQRNYERSLETRLQTMLDQALGPDHAVVRVSATFNWDQKQTDSETYAPRSDGTGVVRSEQTQQEIVDTSGSLPAGGVPGVDSNTRAPTYPSTQVTTTAASLGGKYTTKLNTTRNYEISKVTQTVVQAPGTVQCLSVAVILDNTLPQTQTTGIQAMMAAAAGVDTTRGDSVVVQSIPFQGQAGTTTTTTGPFSDEQKAAMMDYIKIGALALGLLVLLRFAYVTFRELSRRLSGDYVPYVKTLEQELPAPASAQPQLSERSRAAQSAFATDEMQPLPEPHLHPGLPQPNDAPSVVFERDQHPQEPQVVPESTISIMRKQLAVVAQRDPELVAELIQTWLAENS
jgi:flagellar M-ring protein FliF